MRWQQILIAVAVNLLLLVVWWQERPLARLRVSAFVALAPRRGWWAGRRRASPITRSIRQRYHSWGSLL